jgi:hypothetical protein
MSSVSILQGQSPNESSTTLGAMVSLATLMDPTILTTAVFSKLLRPPIRAQVQTEFYLYARTAQSYLCFTIGRFDERRVIKLMSLANSSIGPG